MAVSIRMKKMGRRHRHFFRICATNKKNPRDGRVLEELGTYDPMIADADARAQLNNDRIDYWLGVGAQPSDKVAILIKKYGTNGTHLDAHRAALEKLAMPTEIPDAGEPVKSAEPEEPKAEEKPAEEAAAEAPAEEAKAEEPKAEEEAKPEETKPEEAAAEEAKAEEEKPAEDAADDKKEEAKAEG